MRRKTIAVLLIFILCLTGCAEGTPEAVSGTAVTETQTASGTAVSEPAASETTPTPKEPLPGFKDRSGERYEHGEDGYYTLAEDGIKLDMRAQEGGTCWLFAATMAMETAYQIHNHKTIKLDTMSLLDVIYGDDKKEGYFLHGGPGPLEEGGFGILVVNILSNGFGDGLVLDGAIDAIDFTPAELRDGIRKYGALDVGIPDSDASKKGSFRGYSTVNHVTDDPADYDHSVAFVGWDDHFPKDYFKDPASQDGAWIAYNSQSNSDYFYYSYDMDIDRHNDDPYFLSVSDAYSHVESYDVGNDQNTTIQTGEKTIVGNVFHKKGTLSAVGTFCLKDSQSVVIKIYDAGFNNCLYEQSEVMMKKGYHTIRLDEPQEVEDYALVIEYAGKAPVEGDGWKDDTMIRKTVCKKGQSYVYLNGRWMDLHDKATIRELGCKRKPNNCNIKALYA